jgi:hypothetical protein
MVGEKWWGVLGDLDDRNEIIRNPATEGKGIALKLLHTRTYTRLQNTNPTTQFYHRISQARVCRSHAQPASTSTCHILYSATLDFSSLLLFQPQEIRLKFRGSHVENAYNKYRFAITA